MIQSVIARRIVVAGGVFAPGHLGELTRITGFPWKRGHSDLS